MRAALRLALLFLGGVALAADPLPPKPAQYVEDQAGLLDASTRHALVQKLEAFERETSDQVLVAIYPTVPGDYTMEDFTQRTFAAWGVGQKARNNGVVFFVFKNDRKMRIEVGYGLEGAIPDATAKSILNGEVTPAFRRGDFDGGVTSGVDAILAAARGEYKGNGRTNAEQNDEVSPGTGLVIVFLIITVFIFIARFAGRSSGWDYNRRGTRRRHDNSWWDSGGWGGGGGFGGGSSGGGGGFDSGGGFSGGGGDSGGGGASGGW